MECSEEERFFQTGEIFSGAGAQMVFFMLFPGFPFLGEHEVEEWSKNLALAA